MRMLSCFPGGAGKIRRSFSFCMKFPSVPSIHLSKEDFMPIVFAVIGGFMGSWVHQMESLVLVEVSLE